MNCTVCTCVLILFFFCSQRSLAELTEMIYIGFLIHRGIVDRRILLKNESSSLVQMELGNKMSVLSGDYLFANACVALSELNNSKVCLELATQHSCCLCYYLFS